MWIVEAGIEVGGRSDRLEVLQHRGLAVDHQGPAAREAGAQLPAGVDRGLDADDHRGAGHDLIAIEHGTHLRARNQVCECDVAAGGELRPGVVGHEHDVAPAAGEPQRPQIRVQGVPDRPVDDDVAVGGRGRRLGQG